MHSVLLMGGALDGRTEAIKRLNPTLTFYGHPPLGQQGLIEHTYHQMGKLGNYTIYQSSDYNLNFVDQLVSAYYKSRKVSGEVLTIKPPAGFEEVVAVLAEHTQLVPHLIRGGTSFNDMHLDSLDKVEVVMHLEERFGVEIPDRIAENLETVDDLVDAVSKEY